MSSRLPIGVATTKSVPGRRVSSGIPFMRGFYCTIGSWPDGGPSEPVSCTISGTSIRRMHAAEPFPHFVDDYLNYLYEAHPTSATLDGVHLHDDLLEDFRRPALDTHLSALAGFARRLDAIPVDPLP